DVDARLRRPCVCGPRREWVAVGVADDSALMFGNQPRVRAHRIVDAFPHLRRVWGDEFERNCSRSDEGAVNGRACRCIVTDGVTDAHEPSPQPSGQPETNYSHVELWVAPPASIAPR